jgi:hypothetical protein
LFEGYAKSRKVPGSISGWGLRASGALRLMFLLFAGCLDNVDAATAYKPLSLHALLQERLYILRVPFVSRKSVAKCRPHRSREVIPGGFPIWDVPPPGRLPCRTLHHDVEEPSLVHRAFAAKQAAHKCVRDETKSGSRGEGTRKPHSSANIRQQEWCLLGCYTVWLL